ncbi:MAG TPA: hypothetical protein VFU46_03285 [Gemmatimonadales bacterium]|nr:hypothetical protein [Gemmatimonadales bacterium]
MDPANLRAAVGRASATAVVLLAGCSFAPEGDAPMEAPAEYRAWFARTEACSGREGDFDRIRWHVVDGESFECPSGRCVGRWNNSHDIYIASVYVRHELVVRHEMLHELLGRPGHPDPPFGTGCPLTWESWRGAEDTGAAVTGRVVGLGLTRID